MSHYEPGSELSRLNRHPVGAPFAVSEPTLSVLDTAQRVQAASGGAFDVTIGRAIDAWGFGPSDQPRRVLPAEAVREIQRQHVGGALVLDIRAGTVTRRTAVLANLSGIAKGYGVDRVALALDALGFSDYMVEVGGEIRTRGHNAKGQAWQLAIERPDAMPQQALLVVPLRGRSLATSGDYRNFFVTRRPPLTRTRSTPPAPRRWPMRWPRSASWPTTARWPTHGPPHCSCWGLSAGWPRPHDTGSRRTS